MKYSKTVTLKDGRICTIRNGTAEDGEALIELFISVHAQTDYLLTYPDEHSYTAAQEADFLQKKTDSAAGFTYSSYEFRTGEPCHGRGDDRFLYSPLYGCRMNKATERFLRVNTTKFRID